MRTTIVWVLMMISMQGRKLNKKIKLIKEQGKYPDEFYVEVMDSMYLPESGLIMG